ncbi:TM2 domain-containing protein [Candidatus Saccharibacteria bacterium]|nr:TM2 domain-containing protein [Candidatus Saccharibacteria bacterium]
MDDQNTQPIKQTTNIQIQPIIPKDKRRHFLAAFFLSYIWGVFGADRFYLGKIWTGLLKLLTLGGFGIWAIVDLAVIMSGGMRDKNGQGLIDAERYRKFASRTVSIISFATIILIALSAVSLYFGFKQFNDNGGFEQLLKNNISSQSQNIDASKLQETLKSLNIKFDQ